MFVHSAGYGSRNFTQNLLRGSAAKAASDFGGGPLPMAIQTKKLAAARRPNKTRRATKQQTNKVTVRDDLILLLDCL
jgi:hypothetical protein